MYYNKGDLKLAKEVENLTIWSFAHLFENPFLSNEDIYFSKTRTLSARNGEWLTFDPMIKWNVEQLLNSPVDFNGFKYVNGDPVNFVDPSGYYSQEFQAVINESFGRDEPQRAMNSIKDGAKTAGYIAGAGATVGTLAVVGPSLLAAAAPKVAGFTLAATIEYNSAMIGIGQYVAKNPQKVESFITNSIDFIDNFSGGLGGPQTGTPPETLGGAIGYGTGYLLNKGIYSFVSFNSASSSIDSGFRFSECSASSNDSYSFGNWDF